MQLTIASFEIASYLDQHVLLKFIGLSCYCY